MYDNLNYYKVFYTVAKKGSISRAADVLYISQPAISKSISNLEKGLGTPLFERTSKGVKLTAEGEVLYSHVSKAFENLLKGEDEIKRINDLGIGQLRIGVSTSLCKFILLDYLQRFIVENPHIKMFIDCHSTFNTLKLLQDDSIDVGLICETNIPVGYSFIPVAEIHDIFVTSKSYLENLNLRETEDTPSNDSNPWLFAGNYTNIIPDEATSVPKTVSINNNILSTKEILEKSNLMLLEKNNITRAHIDHYLDSEGIYPNQILEINNMDLLIDFSTIGMGVASVVREFAKEQLDAGTIFELPLDRELEKRAVGLVYSNNKSKSKALSKFINFFN